MHKSSNSIYIYLIHIELARRNLDRNEIWAQYPSTALIKKAAKSFVPWNAKGHGKVPYQKPQLKSVTSQCMSRRDYGMYTMPNSTMCGVNSTRNRVLVVFRWREGGRGESQRGRERPVFVPI